MSCSTINCYTLAKCSIVIQAGPADSVELKLKLFVNIIQENEYLIKVLSHLVTLPQLFLFNNFHHNNHYNNILFFHLCFVLNQQCNFTQIFFNMTRQSFSLPFHAIVQSPKQKQKKTISKLDFLSCLLSDKIAARIVQKNKQRFKKTKMV